MGGTIPYLMTDEKGGLTTRDMLLVQQLPSDERGAPAISVYDERTIARITEDAPANGYTVLMIPAFSEVAVDPKHSAWSSSWLSSNGSSNKFRAGRGATGEQSVRQRAGGGQILAEVGELAQGAWQDSSWNRPRPKAFLAWLAYVSVYRSAP